MRRKTHSSKKAVMKDRTRENEEDEDEVEDDKARYGLTGQSQRDNVTALGCLRLPHDDPLLPRRPQRETRDSLLLDVSIIAVSRCI
jgi:hypothetical protein